MNLFLCVSKGGGRLFNHRRQAFDPVQIENMVTYAGAPLWVNGFSHKLLSKYTDHPLVLSSSPLEEAGAGAWVFVEDLPLAPYMDRVETLVIYHWNVKYPTDTVLDIDPREAGFRRFQVVEFAGVAHKKITREVWVRK